jgi:hypothetical protein
MVMPPVWLAILGVIRQPVCQSRSDGKLRNSKAIQRDKNRESKPFEAVGYKPGQLWTTMREDYELA